MARPDKTSIINLLTDIFARRGGDTYLGEQVTMAEHMLQAAWLAEEAGASEELIAAALLHDVGHFTGVFGAYSPADTKDRSHDQSGAQFLSPHFPPLISECVRLHVAAKRYLCAMEAGYYGQLSEASVHTLSLQGGPMAITEVNDFETHRFHQAAIRVRKWDDQGKIAGKKTKKFEDYLPLLQGMVYS